MSRADSTDGPWLTDHYRNEYSVPGDPRDVRFDHANKTGLEYVLNTAGNATVAHFQSDFEPIGEAEWRRLRAAGFVETNDEGKIVLTDAGRVKLSELR